MAIKERTEGLSAKDHIQVLVLARVTFDPQDKLHYIESPHLDLIRAGRDPEEANAVFAEAVHILIDGWCEKGILAERLAEIGFQELRIPAVTESATVLYCPPGLDILPHDFDDDFSRFKGSQIQAIPFEVGSGTLCHA